ncbi:MAG: general secretion pathway protein GspB [Candidatus Thiodiazotropha sp.]
MPRHCLPQRHLLRLWNLRLNHLPNRPAGKQPGPRRRYQPSISRRSHWFGNYPRRSGKRCSSCRSDIHVYHENPQRRFVIINMHRYVEGDRLKEKGYRLERIDKDGIVLDYGPGLVRIPRS